jgi:hypothetical protein
MLTQSTPLYRRRLGKSVAHAEIQSHLKKKISSLELEKIVNNRRADACWEEKKIVFEIQLSPLSYDEAIKRSEDYARHGYHIVWILHENVFNRQEISPAEFFLRSSYPTYFTNGALVYDQIEVIKGDTRLYRGDPLPIQLSSPCIPFLKIAGRTWKLHFAGDLHTWCAVHGTKTIDKMHRPARGVRLWLQWMGFRILEFVSRNPK